MTDVAKDSFTKALRSQFFGDHQQKGVDVRRSNVKAVEDYFGASGATPFDGSRFETYGHQLGADDFSVTAADLVAVTLLSMEIRRASRSGITTAHVLALEDRSKEVSALLRQIPADCDLHDLSTTEFERILGMNSPGQDLWNLLRGGIGMHRVATFKLLARKRPRLCPIADSRTEAVLSRQHNWWRAWHLALSSSSDLVTEIETIRRIAAEATPDSAGLSILRVADIVLWAPMAGSA